MSKKETIRLISFALIAAMVIPFAGCGDRGSQQS